MRAHAKLSPSAASRWLECTAAPAAEAGFKEEYSEYAAEGTFAHELAELETRYAIGTLSSADYSVQFKMKSTNEFYSQEMLDHVQEYSTYIKEKVASLEGSDPVVELEVRLDLQAWVPEGFGTADCIIVAEGHLWVIDFKYGKGVAVEAEDNPQMKLYALGAFAKYLPLYDIDQIHTVIIQPRLGGVSEAEISDQDLMAWGSHVVAPRAKKAYEGNGEYKPGESTCRFCKAAGSCKARADYFIDLFDDAETKGLMTAEETADYLRRAAGVKDWVESMKETVFNALMAGEEIAGWKLVEGKSNRKYSDENEVYRRLKAKRFRTQDLYEKKILGIGKMEKLVGKKKLQEICGDLIVKPKGAPTLAPADDNRPEWKPEDGVLEAFDEGE